MAGAGTGKTKTLVARCLDCIERDGAGVDELLIVTFTEAAAAELRQRLRRELEKKSADAPDEERWPRQLALFELAHIGTLHSFCLKLIRGHFYELGLDPQFTVLDDGGTRQLAGETLDEQFQSHYEGEDEFSKAVQNLIQIHGGGRDEKIRALILRLHDYSQTRPDAAGWLAHEREKFSAREPADWQDRLRAAIEEWRDEWRPILENLKTENIKAAELAGILSRLQKNFTREQAAEILEEIGAADLTASYPKGKAGKLRPALGDIFEEADFLASFAKIKNGNDPLAEDWNWVRGQMETLLRLAQEFSEKFSERKRADGVLDFHDFEQFALKLLWNFLANQPTAVAESWRAKLRFIFVDEYQDINAAQDKIIAALARDDAAANRFLVGDVKQSIYRFRLADPTIFRDYAKNWRGKNGGTIPLSENFRSRESLLDFVNSIFSLLMREEIGGVTYDADAQLKFGLPQMRENLSAAKDSAPRVELLLRLKAGRNDPADEESELANLDEAQKEARLIATRLKRLVADKHEIFDGRENKFRPVEWRDIAILLPAPRGKSEIFAKEFERAGISLVVKGAGFYDNSETLDLLSLLQLLDNPLQDVPCIAVLRSPLVGLSLDELAEIRLAAPGEKFWTALARSAKSDASRNETRAKIGNFLERFARWRKLARQSSLSRCLEEVLAETHYAEWLRSRPRGAQRSANVSRFLRLAEKFDQFQRQGLFRFLKFIEAQRDTETEPDVATVADENAVHLMSIHKSKGLEFPVVVVADLAKGFNAQDLHDEIIFDEELGLCPRVKPPHTGRRYSSLSHWLAQRRQRRELLGEQLRLLYVALTRARDNLILSASITEKNWLEQWTPPQLEPLTTGKIAGAKSFADWLRLWFARQNIAGATTQGELKNLRWRIADDAELTETPGSEKREEKAVATELDAKAEQKIRETLTWQYGFQSATERAAKSSVTALRREADESDDEAVQIFPARRGLRAKLSAAETGTAHHKFLQHFSFEDAANLKALAAEADRLEHENILTADERAVLDLKSVAAFWNSRPGLKIREQPPESVKRELAFTAKFASAEIEKLLGRPAEPELQNEFVVVQGIADLLVLLPEEIWLVDFKTDAGGENESSGKIKTYSLQLKLYATALGKIYSRPVTNCWLHFLSAHKTVDVEI
jgi:ATP-dependent helicase/nuclease subunit A